ncbi:MAG TPA: TetR/AcrR family transcriptional regulator [Nocardioides sp.]|nr:TetR/AcrR family transcriptional regulator [Nocardioides sp.]
MNVERLNESVNARSYDSPTRRAQAEKTRRQIADAARNLFVERGWSGTRVRDVAAAAGVSEPTVYAVYGNKAGLATALLDSLTAAVDFPRHMSELAAAEGDPQRQIAALVAIDRQLFEHGADAITVIREAGRTNPDLAHVYAAGRQQGDEARRRVYGSWPARVWREGVGLEDALDTAAAVLSVDVYLELTHVRGWSPDRVQAWWADTLVRLLLRDPPPVAP